MQARLRSFVVTRFGRARERHRKSGVGQRQPCARKGMVISSWERAAVRPAPRYPMAKCSYCNSTIVIGGVRDGDLRFCNQRCQEAGALLRASRAVPDDEVQKRVTAIHQGPCPKCQRAGPVDIHTSHTVWSMLILTSWKSKPQMSCTPCGKKAKAFAAAGSFVFGWWGFPWGLILTPIQVGRNLWGIVSTPSSMTPSAQLEKIARLTLAAELQARQSAAVPPAAN